jgi:hypothetical protein
MNNKAGIARWRRDPVAFIREALINPETGKPFELYPAEISFLREDKFRVLFSKVACALSLTRHHNSSKL